MGYGQDESWLPDEDDLLDYEVGTTPVSAVRGVKTLLRSRFHTAKLDNPAKGVKRGQRYVTYYWARVVNGAVERWSTIKVLG